MNSRQQLILLMIFFLTKYDVKEIDPYETKFKIGP